MLIVTPVDQCDIVVVVVFHGGTIWDEVGWGGLVYLMAVELIEWNKFS